MTATIGEENDSTATKVANFVSMVALVTIAVLLCAFMFHGIFVANPPLTFEEPIALDKESYRPGDTMIGSLYNACRYTDAPSTAYITYVNLEDATRYFIQALPGNSVPEGCVKEIRVPTIVGLVPPGRYTVFVRIVYEIGGGFTREIDIESVPFEVLPISDR